MEVAPPLFRGTFSLEDASKEDRDILQELSYPDKRVDFWLRLHRSRQHMEEVIAQHLRLPRSHVRVGDLQEWIHGSFNACLPVYITSRQARGLPKKLMMRFLLPYKVGEEVRPGNVDEKLRCEAATYVWLQQHCPEIPVPPKLARFTECFEREETGASWW
ncbi:hypothetical protein VTK73DRAFT_7934 [Phialemonium thermophilum]|uniref:Uncharacterized protein n=1 Tax=Phialemonium thermophilum TaxID=223376 RepID=A0ABR3WCE1_9PEZI